jgi:hypothetical protein
VLAQFEHGGDGGHGGRGVEQHDDDHIERDVHHVGLLDDHHDVQQQRRLPALGVWRRRRTRGRLGSVAANRSGFGLLWQRDGTRPEHLAQAKLAAVRHGLSRGGHLRG